MSAINLDFVLAHQLVRVFVGNMQLGIPGERIDVSVLFCDISGYNSLTEKLSGEQLALLLNEYFQLMGESVYKYKQTAEKQITSACIGNRLIVIFGSPQPLENHAWIAVQTAREMGRQVTEFNRRRQAQNQPAIKIGIGIHSDKVLTRNISAGRGMDFMAIGADVHVGYRLEGICKQYGCNIVISQNTYQLCADQIRVRELDLIRLPGENRATSIYEYLGPASEAISPQKQEALDHYSKGRQHYLNRKFGMAMGEFATVMEIDNSDKAASIQLMRCQHWLDTPPNDDNWDGSWPGS